MKNLFWCITLMFSAWSLAAQNDTISLPSIRPADERILSYLQPYVGRSQVPFKVSVTKAPNSNGAHWYVAYGEGNFQWSNPNRLTADYDQYFSDRRSGSAPFNASATDRIRLDLDATNGELVVTLITWGGAQRFYRTRFANGLLQASDNAGTIILITFGK